MTVNFECFGAFDWQFGGPKSNAPDGTFPMSSAKCGPKVNQTAFSGAKYRLGRKFTVSIVYGLKTTHAWL